MRLPLAREIKEPRQILVEGRDAEGLLSAMIGRLGLGGLQIQDFGGKDELPGFLQGYVRGAGFNSVTHLGVVRDAEGNAAGALQSVRQALVRARLAGPSRINTPTGASPVVTVLILPDGQKTGMIEDVCLDSVALDPAYPCLGVFFECLDRSGINTPNMSKARLQAFLASRPQPGLLLGQAARAGYWDFDSTAFEPLRVFLGYLSA